MVSLQCVSLITVIKKALSQWLQWNGFSPVYFLICLVSSLFLKKDLSHLLHLNGFSYVCSYMLFLDYNTTGMFCHNACIEIVYSPQCVSLYVFFWIVICENTFSWWLHWNIFQTRILNSISIFFPSIYLTSYIEYLRTIYFSITQDTIL